MRVIARFICWTARNKHFSVGEWWYYGCENWLTNSNIIHKVNVAWNNCFRRIFSRCWQQSVKPLQYFTGTLCMFSMIDHSRLIFWKQMHMSQNINLSIVSRFVLNRFIATGSVYDINYVAVSFSAIKNSIGLHLPVMFFNRGSWSA